MQHRFLPWKRWARDFVSMCSTEEGTFGSDKNSPKCRAFHLLAALAKKSALVRSDQIAVRRRRRHVPAPSGRSCRTPKNGTFEVGSCYVDYFL